MTARFSLLTLGPAIVLALIFWWLSAETLSLLLAWLLSITIVTFLTFGYDKVLAGSRFMRVPENVLYLLTALGGVVGGALGMVIFRHKTRKRPFLIRFAIAALVAIILFGSLLFWSLSR